MTEAIAIREFADDDWPFVVDSWTRSYARSPWAGALVGNLQKDTIRATVNRLRDRDTFRCLVAACAPDPRQILGYLAFDVGFDFPCVYYVYTKELFRASGVARALIENLGLGDERVRVPFVTKVTKKIFPNCRYAPGIVRRII